MTGALFLSPELVNSSSSGGFHVTVLVLVINSVVSEDHSICSRDTKPALGLSARKRTFTACSLCGGKRLQHYLQSPLAIKRPPILCGARFSPTRPHWAELVIESPCPSVEMCVCLRHRVQFFFEASHWPSDHMTRSRPLIGQPPPPPPDHLGGGG